MVPLRSTLRRLAACAGAFACCAALASAAHAQPTRPMEGLRGSGPPPPRFLLSVLPAGVAKAYATGTVADVNLAPFAFEWAWHERMGLQVRSWTTLRIRPDLRQVGHVGVGVLLPIYRYRAGRYLGRTREGGVPYDGGFVAPLVEVTRDVLDRSTSFTLGAEVGYRGTFESVWSWSVGVQGGGSFIVRDGPDETWPHLGLYLGLGRWFG